MTELSSDESVEESYDVFLCHNSLDKAEVRSIVFRLKNRGFSACLDLHALIPGRAWLPRIMDQIRKSRSGAICVGNHGLGQVQVQEINLILPEFRKRDRPIIPVILSDAKGDPRLPESLRQETWVDFRVKEPDPIDRLIWGITGRKTDRGTNEEHLMEDLYKLGDLSESPDYEGFDGALAQLKRHWDARESLGLSPSTGVRATTPTGPGPQIPALQESLSAAGPPPTASGVPSAVGRWSIHCLLANGCQRRMTLILRPDGSCEGTFELSLAGGIGLIGRGTFAGGWALPAANQFAMRGTMTQVGSIFPMPFQELVLIAEADAQVFRGSTVSGEHWVGIRQAV